MPTQTDPARATTARRGVSIGSGRRLFFAVLVLGMMLALCAPFFVDLVARDAPAPRRGEVDYARWGPLDAPVELAGEWRLVWRAGGSGAVAPGDTALVRVPGKWEGAPLPGGGTLPGEGLASYELTLKGVSPGRHMLHVPILYGANRLYVDGRLIDSHGVAGVDAASTRTTVRSHEVPVEASGAPITLRIDFAAFHHRDTGFGDPPVIGLAEPMRRWITLEWTKDLLFHAALLLLAANTFIAFLFRRQDRASLFLSLSALCAIPGTAVISYDNLLLVAVPGLPFGAMLALQYLFSNCAIAFFLAYARALFPAEAPRALFWSIEAMIGAYFLTEAAAFVAGDPLAASNLAVYWPLVSGITFAGVIGIVLRAAIRGRDGAVVFLLGIALFATSFVNATLSWSGLVPPHLLMPTATLPLGMLMLLFSHFVVVAERWSLAIINAEQVNDDLRELLEVSSAITSEMHVEALLSRIVEVTSRILDADRSSLLLHDPRTGELWSLVAEGVETREIRIPAATGLGGHAFTTGETVNIADAYADPRFQRQFDISTGYRTRTILTMPITARDGRRLGVMQALNRRDGRAFDRADIKRMAAFAAQAAIAIDNATLFSEVVASRNYNESILRSMSNGVVTLDRDAEIGKLNAAASRILGLPASGAEGLNARALLAGTNPWLVAELDAVGASGESKLLLDVDLTTGHGTTVSANISIVPLIGESETVGLLLLVEDISEGKRLQGAMRRFMTQKVVDQVLERGDELLFGTACEASVLFADIRNFTSMAEALTPRETVDMLNEAFTEFFEAVAAHDGVLDKFIGDAIMAVYGAPLSSGRDALNAVESGVHMLRVLGELNERRAARALPPLRLGIGIASGEVVAGTIGSPKRMDYTVIGDSVNLAARLQDLTKGYGVEMLVCERTAGIVGERHRMRELDLITVRGRKQPAKIFQVIAPGVEPAPGLLQAYQRGRDHLARHDWRGAIAAFEDALAADPDDQPAAQMLARARALADNAPAQDWDGVWRATAVKA